MKNMFFKGVALTLTAALTLLFAACGGKTSDSADAQETANAVETESTAAQEETSPENDMLQAYYDGNFDPALSGCGFPDFDEDGKNEMFVAEYKANSADKTALLSLIYYRVADGAVEEADRYAIDFAEDILSSDALLYEGDSPDGAGELMVYLNGSTILCNLYGKMNNWYIDYIQFAVKDDKIVLERHLEDNGETSGLSILDRGSTLFEEEDVPYVPLFSRDDLGNVTGTYDSYAAVLKGEFNSSLKWEQFHAAESYDDGITKGQIVPDDATNLILDLKNF